VVARRAGAFRTLDLARVDTILRLIETSSPPFPVLASLDLARRRLAVSGAEDWGRAVALAVQTASLIARGSRGWLCPLIIPGGLDQDPTRLTLILTEEAPADLTGLGLARAIAADAVDVEMAGWGHIVAVTGPADTPLSHGRLVSAMTRALEARTHSGPKRELALAMEKDCWEAERVLVMTPAEAFRHRGRLVSVDEAAGRVAKDIISPYPPGVPLVFPGQRITEADALYLTFLGQWGARAHGLTERTAQVEVIA
jgi:arginine decarboxylase